MKTTSLSDIQLMDHEVFSLLEQFSDFYKSLSLLIYGSVPNGVSGYLGLDSYQYDASSETLNSILEILNKGRINDAYALLRKYLDSVIINIYCIIIIKKKFSISNLIVKEIDDWVKNKGKLPNIKVMLVTIRETESLKELNDLINKDNRYKNLRDKCNDQLHYNYYNNILANNTEVYVTDAIKYLNTFAQDVIDIFILHLSYLFYLNDHYMQSSDYIDCLELGLTPPEGAEYAVASFIQDIFNTVFRNNRPDLLEYIKKCSCMRIE